MLLSTADTHYTCMSMVSSDQQRKRNETFMLKRLEGDNWELWLLDESNQPLRHLRTGSKEQCYAYLLHRWHVWRMILNWKHL